MILDELSTLLLFELVYSCPVLSGNMKSGVHIESISDKSITLQIDAPFYNNDLFNKKGVIQYTGENRNGVTDYAESYNRLGAFNTGKGHPGPKWVNNAILDCCLVVASEYGGEVINELPK